jgi:hypothetical protein
MSINSIYHTLIKPVINSCNPKICINYSDQLERISNELKFKEEYMNKLFINITSYTFKPNNKDIFKPEINLNGCISPIPNDLNVWQQMILASLLPEIEDAELRARVADILHLLEYEPGYEHAQIAMDAYIKNSAASDRVFRRGIVAYTYFLPYPSHLVDS